MGGVTGEQDPAVTVGVGEPPVDPERRNPLGITQQRWIATSPFPQLTGDFGSVSPVGPAPAISTSGSDFIDRRC
jgi:hypothetical protein